MTLWIVVVVWTVGIPLAVLAGGLLGHLHWRHAQRRLPHAEIFDFAAHRDAAERIGRRARPRGRVR